MALSKITTASLSDDSVSTDQIANNAVINTSGAITTTGAFTSVGIDDNADTTTLTLDTNEDVTVGNGVYVSGDLSSLTIDKGGIDRSGNTTRIISARAGGNYADMSINVAGVNKSDGNNGMNRCLYIDYQGNTTIDQGNLIIGTAGKGINFSATSDGSGANQAEILDDYEEGTWTPTLTSGGTITTINAATYTKIGNIIRIGFYLTLSSIPNNSSAFYIGGLPYNVSYTAGGGNDHYHGAGSITYVGAHNINSFGMLPPTPYTGQATMYFHRGDGNQAVVRNSDVTGMPYIICATSYMTA